MTRKHYSGEFKERVMGRKLRDVEALPEGEPLEALESGFSEDVEESTDV